MADLDGFYKNLIDNLYDGIYFVDRERVITFWNKGAERITGYASAQVVGHSCRDNLLNHVAADGVQLCLDDCPLAACMRDGRMREAEVFLHHAEGYRVPVMVRASPIRDGGGSIIGAVETFNSNEGLLNTRRQLTEVQRTALTDPLTGIGNRRFLENHLSAAIAESRQNQNRMGLLFVDIDSFKAFNDVHGHEVGDKVLRMVVGSLNHNLRATDTIGRWGGDEFVAIIDNVQDLEDLQNVAQKLRHLVQSSRLDLFDRSLTVTVSIGATLLNPNDTFDSFIFRADQLMYQSKQTGRNQVSAG
ncbi:MAG TPA: sensor domain-containing diguanylate cyclase [Anaerolineales bacterium]|nr:sensor domain-containing diguanylate cyclase [Anaerolineales bacterium]